MKTIFTDECTNEIPPLPNAPPIEVPQRRFCACSDFVAPGRGYACIRNVDRIGVFASASASTYLLENLADHLNASQPTASLQAWLGNESIPDRSAQRIFKAADQILKAGTAADLAKPSE